MSSDASLKAAKKEVANANNEANKTAARAKRAPNSQKKAAAAKKAEENVQIAREKEVRTEILNSTIGQMPADAVNTLTSSGVNIMLDKHYYGKNK